MNLKSLNENLQDKEIPIEDLLGVDINDEENPEYSEKCNINKNEKLYKITEPETINGIRVQIQKFYDEDIKINNFLVVMDRKGDVRTRYYFKQNNAEGLVDIMRKDPKRALKIFNDTIPW